MRYVRKTPNYIQKWSKENPEISATFLQLNEAGVRSGIYCGTAAEIGTRNPRHHLFSGGQTALSAVIDFLANRSDATVTQFPTLPYEADDVDVVVHDNDFPLAVDILDSNVENETRSFEAADGYTFEYSLSVARKKIGQKVIEICHADGPMVAQKGASIIKYHWSITDYAAAHFLNFKTRQGVVPLAHPGETHLIYGILLRPATQCRRLDVEKAKLAIWATMGFSQNINTYCDTREAEIVGSQDTSRFRQFDDQVVSFWNAKQHEYDLSRPRGGVWLENWPNL